VPATRLTKILARAGITSRRSAEVLLAAGRITVNGRVSREPGAQADPERDVIALDGVPVATPAPRTYVLLHKPRGYLSSVRDPAGRPVVVELLPPSGPRLFPVGRLDWDAEGLLLLTNDGELGNRLLHPRYQVPRVYEVEVRGHVRRRDLGRWRAGVTLADGPAVPAAMRLLRRGHDTSWISLTFTEGRNREVKRYCQALGHPLVRLRRVEFGPLRLGSLAPGRSRPLTRHEVQSLERLHPPGRSTIIQRVR
jgi:23S rRNA pseudouridine2605 synthase